MDEIQRLEIKEVYNSVKKLVGEILKSNDLTVKTSGFKKTISTEEYFNTETGYWKDLSMNNKPQRLIFHLVKDNDKIIANFPTKNDGTEYTGSRTIGIINNRQGNCRAGIHAATCAIKINDSEYIFPEWEWVVLIIFGETLPAGTSGETLSKINETPKTIKYSSQTYPISLIGIYESTVSNEQIINNNLTYSYSEATLAIKELLSQK